MRSFFLVLAIPVVFVWSGCFIEWSPFSGATARPEHCDAGDDLASVAPGRDADGVANDTGTAKSKDPGRVWRRTVGGWEKIYDWPKAASPRFRSPNLAGRLHPALLALIIAGIAIGALVAGTPQHLLLVHRQ